MGRPLNPAPPLTYRQIFAFWFPLGVMWLMMAAEQPALSAVIARMPDPEVNLAAFGVVWAIALVAESPIIQMLSASTALSATRESYHLLLRFMHIMAVSLSALHLLIGLTPLFDLIVRGLLGVPDAVADASRLPFIVMAPFSAAVGYRRLWQGVLIRHGRTWVVPVSMIARLLAMAGVLAAGFLPGAPKGALLAAFAISCAVIVAAVVAGVLNRVFVVPTLPKRQPGEEPMGWHGLLRFYVPLSLTTVVFLLAQPVVTFGMARALEPQRSLAVWPVVNGLLFMFNSLALSHQEAAIALLKRSPQSRDRLRRFTFGLAAVASGLMLATNLSGGARWWFSTLSGLGGQLLPLTVVPALVLSAVPGLITLKAWYRGLYVSAGKTGILARGVVIYIGVLFIAVFAAAASLSLAGAAVAALTMVLAQALENGYLLARRPERTWERAVPAGDRDASPRLATG